MMFGPSIVLCTIKRSDFRRNQAQIPAVLLPRQLPRQSTADRSTGLNLRRICADWPEISFLDWSLSRMDGLRTRTIISTHFRGP